MPPASRGWCRVCSPRTCRNVGGALARHVCAHKHAGTNAHACASQRAGGGRFQEREEQMDATNRVATPRYPCTQGTRGPTQGTRGTHRIGAGDLLPAGSDQPKPCCKTFGRTCTCTAFDPCSPSGSSAGCTIGTGMRRRRYRERTHTSVENVPVM